MDREIQEHKTDDTCPGHWRASAQNTASRLPGRHECSRGTPHGPLPLAHTKDCAAEFPLAALGSFKPAVEAVVARLQVPPALAASSALAVASLAVQAHVNVETLGGFRPCSLFVLSIAASGERKTSCDELLLRGLRTREQEDRQLRIEALHHWKVADTLWRARETALKKAAACVETSDELADVAAAFEALGPAPAPPPLAERTVGAPTRAGLLRMMREGLPSLGLVNDEGGQMIGGHALSGSERLATMAMLNRLWDGSTIDQALGSTGHTALPGRRLALHLMMQPLVADRILMDPLTEQSGFLARCLMSAPESRIGHRLIDDSTHAPEDHEIELFNRRLHEILSRPPRMDPATGGLETRIIPLCKGAHELLVRFYNAIEMRQAAGEALAPITAHASKSAEQACRIAAVLAAWTDLEVEQISAEDMARGITLAQYYLAEALRLLTRAEAFQRRTRAERLQRWLVETWPHDTVTFSEVQQFGPGVLREKARAEAALELLQQTGWVVPLPSGTEVRGKPRKRAWRIVRPVAEGEDDDMV